MGFFKEQVCEQPMDYTDYVVGELQEMDFDSEEVDEYMAGDYGSDAADWEEEYTNEYVPSMPCEEYYKWGNIILVAGIAIFVMYKNYK